MAADIHGQIPNICVHCSAKLPSRRTIIPNRRRWFLHFASIFVGIIAFWVFMWQGFISKAGTDEGGTFIDMLLMERNAGLVIAILAGVVWHLTRRMPDTVVIRCTACRKDNHFLVRFSDQGKRSGLAPTPPADGSSGRDSLPHHQQQSPGDDA